MKFPLKEIIIFLILAFLIFIGLYQLFVKNNDFIGGLFLSSSLFSLLTFGLPVALISSYLILIKKRWSILYGQISFVILMILYLFISGQLPIDMNGKLLKGKIGKDLTLEEGQQASRFCVLNILAQAKKALDGDLDKIKNCVKITGFVNSSDDFFDQPKVINPASETLAAVFGDKGKHTRAAVSTNSLPLGVAVEIDAIFEIF